MSLALVFPGQGSQSVGMLGSLAEAHPVVEKRLAAASGVLGYDLWQRMSTGPAGLLNATECTQPAMLAAGVATYDVWRERGGRAPECVSGHSLGEFSALVCAGTLDFAAAVDLVRFRGAVMQEAVPQGSGAIAAILGLDDDAVEAACAEAAQGGVVEAVNYNAPSQVVIAGDTAAVNRAMAAALARGAKRAVILPVSVPVHSSLMRGAAAQLRERLKQVALKVPQMRFVSAVDGRQYSEPEAIRDLLYRQLASPVRWSATVRALVASGVTTMIECGPGKVLTALNRRIEKREGLSYFALEDSASIDAALKAIA